MPLICCFIAALIRSIVVWSPAVLDRGRAHMAGRVKQEIDPAGVDAQLLDIWLQIIRS